MDVFVIPLGRDRYELYTEQPVELDQNTDTAPGLVSRLLKRALKRVSVFLRDAEARQRDTTRSASTSWVGKLKDRGFTWIVDRVTEQRLLWNLRGATTATAAHPQDLSFEQVMTLVQADLRHSYERHRRWFVIDGIALAFTSIVLGPFFLLIPGIANLPAVYFGFRTLGHFLSMRGASQGLHRVAWTGRECPPLGELRDVGSLAPDARDARIEDIAARLRLEHLSTFVKRMAVHPA